MKAALMGLEHPHSLAHLATLQQLPEVDSIVLWGETQAAINDVIDCQGFKVEGGYSDLDALLHDHTPFFAIVAVRNNQGPGVFGKVLSAGIHLMAEKPVGRHADETRAVMDMAQRSRRLLSVCYQGRRNPVYMKMRDIVSQGLLGPLISMELRGIYTQVSKRDPHHWLFNKEIAGGGIVSWLGCHDIDRIRFITGEEITTVAAQVGTRSGEDIDVEDTASLSMTLTSGAIASMHLGYILAQSGEGYHNPAGNDVYLGLNGRLGRLHLSGFGSSPVSRLHVESLHPDWAAAPRQIFEIQVAQSPAYGGIGGEQFMREFIHAAQGNGRPPTTGQDALQVARVTDAAYASSDTGQRLDIDLPTP